MGEEEDEEEEYEEDKEVGARSDFFMGLCFPNG